MIAIRALLALSCALLLAACQSTPKPMASPPPTSSQSDASAQPPTDATPPSDTGIPVPPTVESAPAPTDAVTHAVTDKSTESGEPTEPVELIPAPLPGEVPGRLTSGAQVFDALREGFTQPACVAGQTNQTWRRRYAGNPRQFAAKIESSLPLMAYVTEQVRARGLATELALIPIVESWYEPDARGPGGPSGLWQMVAITAKDHGVPINSAYDGRFSVIDSTDAALSYLKHLSRRFDGDWRAMVMAYNAGEFRLLGAFRRTGSRKVSGEARLPKGLSPITYAYVDKLHALACLIAEPQRHGLTLPEQVRFVPLSPVRFADHVDDLRALARRYGIEPGTVLSLNPAYRRGIVPRGAPRRALLPVAAGVAAGAEDATVASSESQTDTSPADATDSGRRHTVSAGDTLSRIAARYGVPLRRLFEINGLSASSVLRIGQVIRLP